MRERSYECSAEQCCAKMAIHKGHTVARPHIFGPAAGSIAF